MPYPSHFLHAGFPSSHCNQSVDIEKEHLECIEDVEHGGQKATKKKLRYLRSWPIV